MFLNRREPKNDEKANVFEKKKVLPGARMGRAGNT
jgi:hypothetical protein